MFESKLILKLPSFSLTYTVREKRRQFQTELTLKHSEARLFLNCLGSRVKEKIEQLPCEQFLQAFEIYRSFLRVK